MMMMMKLYIKVISIFSVIYSESVNLNFPMLPIGTWKGSFIIQNNYRK